MHSNEPVFTNYCLHNYCNNTTLKDAPYGLDDSPTDEAK